MLNIIGIIFDCVFLVSLVFIFLRIMSLDRQVADQDGDLEFLERKVFRVVDRIKDIDGNVSRIEDRQRVSDNIKKTEHLTKKKRGKNVKKNVKVKSKRRS